MKRLATTILLLTSAGIAGLSLTGVGVVRSFADTVVLTSSADNTLYESGTGETSNARGVTMFAGKTLQGFEDLRRAVLSFDVAGNVPPGSTINSVRLTLYLSKVAPGVPTAAMDLHRLTASWGEGTSLADSTGGFGVPATPGDATWVHRFAPSTFWTSPGGDFAAAVSGSTVVGNPGSYTWGSTASMVADVQSWLDTPGGNNGWILIGDETNPGSARRFNTREHVNAGSRPRLTIDYTPGSVPVESATWSRIKTISGR